ncbi:helix-turn-helix transcriptional regulator [Agrobacterium sp. a22-2]|nr:helix-turn-helix transcriptional regulator [Agrobacterium sp. a22-2]NKN39477.1 helix-turn-helix transcriptional regulator [Agrobacterium sp. a22-2]
MPTRKHFIRSRPNIPIAPWVNAWSCEKSADSRIRTYRGMTVSELAAAAGISQPYLSEIESGKKTGSVDVLKRIATVLRVDLDDLVVDKAD